MTGVRPGTGAAVAAALVLLLPAVGARAGSAEPARPAAGAVRVPSGSFVPLYRQPPAADTPRSVRTARAENASKDPGAGEPAAAAPVFVESFEMDVHPVTNAEFLAFVREHPEWRRSRVRRIYADENYLRHWRGDLYPGPGAPARSPVVDVSWFAARAYARARGRELPSVAQWEFAAAAGPTRRDASRDPEFQRQLREWYARPTVAPLPEVGSTFRNAYGIEDLHGLVWEWTLDFNSALITGESRADDSLDRGLYCGAAAAGATDFENYAAFMRYAFRSSLQARYCVGNLGFRTVAAGTETRRGERP